MSLTFDLSHPINGTPVMFHGSVDSAEDALTMIQKLVGAAPAPLQGTKDAASTGKNNKAAATSTPANETDNRSQAGQTQTASDSSANSSSESSAASKSDASDSSAGENVLNYDQHVKPLVLAISKKSREFAEALLQRHRAVDAATQKPSAKALKPEQYAKFVEDAQNVLDGKLDPTASADGDIA